MKRVILLVVCLTSLLVFQMEGQEAKEYQKNDSKIIPIDTEVANYLFDVEWVCYSTEVSNRSRRTYYSSIKPLKLSTDGKVEQLGELGIWQIENGNIIQILMDDNKVANSQNLLRGNYGVISISDTTLVLTKNSTTKEDLRYSYFFRNKEYHGSIQQVGYENPFSDFEKLMDWCVENEIDFNSQPKGIIVLSNSEYFRKILVKTGRLHGGYEMKTLDNGDKIYFRNNEEISKFDFEYDLKLAERYHKN